MAGHSKWANIKRKKEKEDKKRGKVFTKLIRALEAAVRLGGPDPDANPRLRKAIEEAKAANMPKENIERAIKKASGGDEGTLYEECFYEGYGPGGVAVLVESITDNKNRTASDIRHIFSKYGGNLGEAGCVSWIFERKGVFTFEPGSADVEKLFDVAVEAGAEDIRENDDGSIEVYTPPENFEAVKDALKSVGFEFTTGEITRVPKNVVKLSGKEAEQLIRLLEALEDLDDVQRVYANFDIASEVLERLAG